MRSNKSYILLLVLSLALSSCFKEDTPVTPYDRGDVQEKQFSMGEYYAEHFYYSLDQNKIVAQHTRTAWDICLGSDGNNLLIKVNSGRFMKAAEASSLDFSQITDTVGLQFKWDYVNGKVDSLALSGWETSSNVYVLKMGFDEKNEDMGLVKIKFNKESDSKISFEYMDLDGGNQGSGTLSLDDEYNFTYFSLLHGTQVSIEPKKDEYDLYFGQYVFYFEVEDKDYYVNGVLLNPSKVKALQLFTKGFEKINIDDFTETDLVATPDVIGYDWKYYNFDSFKFEIVPNRNYIVMDVKGFLYKIRFTNFYDNQGVKGHPVMEVKKL